MIPTDLLSFVAANPEQTAALAGGLVAAAGHYRRTGRLPLGRLPWRAARGVLRELRDRYFERPRPRGVPALVVDAPPADLESPLRNRHFEGAPGSYQYEGEDLNLRRPAPPRRNPETGDPTPMETHVRAFETTDGRSLVLTHHEANRYEATAEHLDAGLYSWARGRDRAAEVLDTTPLDYHAVPSERDADLEVV